ncbi:hypothetical protein C5E10_13045 [Pseudoclavibacter sp. RFBG4]|uniref:DUF6479 family protein n=1 Tax=Pseudoclavibacter sp. RFBG4 TaxID=2080575 RepID=UPI000CE77E65|nr:DUF6479 family protein [Pseudoclavibacter sp. RFBG4]PPG28803.1 hypothetical protein C5E10_13045 [Pseudoclavibacter sp. RFBG4]
MPNLNFMHVLITIVPLAVGVVVAALTIWALILAIKALRKYLRTPDAPQPQRLQQPAPPEIG